MAVGQRPAEAVVAIQTIAVCSREQHIDDGKRLVELDCRQISVAEPLLCEQKVRRTHGAARALLRIAAARGRRHQTGQWLPPLAAQERVAGEQQERRAVVNRTGIARIEQRPRAEVRRQPVEQALREMRADSRIACALRQRQDDIIEQAFPPGRGR